MCGPRIANGKDMKPIRNTWYGGQVFLVRHPLVYVMDVLLVLLQLRLELVAQPFQEGDHFLALLPLQPKFTNKKISSRPVDYYEICVSTTETILRHATRCFYHFHIKQPPSLVKLSSPPKALSHLSIYQSISLTQQREMPKFTLSSARTCLAPHADARTESAFLEHYKIKVSFHVFTHTERGSPWPRNRETDDFLEHFLFHCGELASCWRYFRLAAWHARKKSHAGAKIRRIMRRRSVCEALFTGTL